MIFLVAFADLLKSDFSDDVSFNSYIFSMPFAPIFTGTPMQMFLWLYWPLRNAEHGSTLFLSNIIDSTIFVMDAAGE